MRWIFNFSFAALAAASVLGGSAALGASAEKGKAAFIKNGCWQCHGFSGQGGNAGLTLAPDPKPLETITAFIRSADGPMPPYSATVISDDDIADIHAYLSSIPKTPDYKSIPLLAQ
ncbi:MAG: c-type cytochrome [Xanthobacteraceae bacterium]